MAIAGYAVGRRRRATSTSAASIRWRSSGCRPPSSRPSGSALLGSRHLRHALQLPHRRPHRRRRLRLRRGDGADRLDRGPARHAAAAPALPGRVGPLGLPDADQQRRDLRQRAADHPQRRRLVRRHRHGEEQGHQGLLPGRQGREHRPVEVPMGTTLREIVEEIGGGVPEGGRFKAVQTGGPSGGCIPAEHLDTPVDYESLAQLGSIMGSGGMIVMDETPTWWTWPGSSWSSAWTSRAASASPAAPGTVQMHRLLDEDRARRGDAGRPGAAGGAVRHGEAHQPVRPGPDGAEPGASTLRYFRDEYDGPHPTSARCPRPGLPIATAEARMSDRMSVMTLTIDGRRRQRREDQTHPRRGPRERHRDPDAVPPRRLSRRRRLPAVPGRGDGHRRLLPACVTAVAEGMEVARPTRRGCASIAG